MDYKCDKCGDEFEHKNQLTGHMTKHRKDKKERKSFNSPKLKLTADTPDGYVDHWFVENELVEAREVGYEMVSDRNKEQHIGEDIESTNTDIGSCISTLANRSTGEKCYLMRIDEKYYKEDRDKTVKEFVDSKIIDNNDIVIYDIKNESKVKCKIKYLFLHKHHIEKTK